MNTRPSRGDTEEDLLRMQEEFLRSRRPPSVTLVKKPDKRKSAGESASEPPAKDVVSLDLPSSTTLTSATPPEKRVKFKQTTAAQRPPSDTRSAEEALDEHDTHIAKVLTDIVERDLRNQPVYYPIGAPHGGFPTVLHRGDVTQEGETVTTPRKKKSLFAQQFMKTPAKDFGIPATTGASVAFSDRVVERHTGGSRPSPASKVSMATLSESHVISGQGLGQGDVSQEVRRIHEENVDRLSGLSEGEILEEQKRLLESLDPSLISFLKRKQAQQTQQQQLPTDASEHETSKSMDTAEKQTNAEKENLPAKPAKDVELPLKPSKEWINMSKIEYDKLEWTKKLPTPKTGDKSTGLPARFDFQGKLVAADQEVPVHEGLHHHGLEPERAGYSLQELFQLCRSTNMQQRVLSLNTLASIIDKARHGAYHETTSTSLIPVLLQGGVLFLIRWALDDTTDNTMAAALACLHRLLVCEEDEAALDHTFPWTQGAHAPALRPPAPEAEGDLYDPDNPQETDADVVKRDVIEGLLRMSLLPRLRYILDKWRPAAPVVVHILQILTRVARHSTQASYQITQCAGLLEVIMTQFLPLHWSPVDSPSTPLANNYGYPVSHALKLVRVLCTSGRYITALLLSKYHVMDRVMRYIGGGPPETLQLNQQEGLLLYAEAYRTWQVCASYGLAMDYYTGVYSVLMENLKSVIQTGNKELCILMCPLLETVVHVVSNSTTEARRRRHEQNTEVSDEVQARTEDALPSTDWSQVAGLYPPIRSLLSTHLRLFQDTYIQTKHDLSHLSCVLNFIASFITESKSQPGYNAVEALSEIEKVVTDLIQPCIRSHAFQVTLDYVREHSVLIYTEKHERGEAPSSLPEVGSLVGSSAQKCPILHPNSTVAFLTAFTRLVLALGRSHKALAEHLFKSILEHEETLQYVRKICICKKSAHATNCFSKFENMFQHHLITMATKVLGGFAHARLYHQMALCLLTHLHHGGESSAHDLLSSAVFSPLLLRDTLEESPQLYLDEALQLQEERYLTSATQEEVRKSRAQLIRETGARLVSVRNTYLQSLSGLIPNLLQSRARCLPSPLSVDKLLCGEVKQLLVPVDWPFMPLVTIYNQATSKEVQKESPLSTAATEQAVVNALRWLHLLECKLPAALDSVPTALKLSRLLCVFLAGSELFLQPDIHAHLLSLLKLYTKPALLDRLDLEAPVPGLTSFYDLFMLAVQHYEAVSFGDPLFACYLLLPLQQRHLVKYRRAVWGEQSSVLTAITLPVNQVVMPVERFLEPEETHVPQLRMYFQALFTHTVTAARTPLPYLIALHHVNRFMYTQDGAHGKLRTGMLAQVLQTKNQTLQRHLLFYKKYSAECEHGLELYDELPSNRKSLVNSVRG